MDGVGTPIIGRPRPIPGHDTPNPANNTYTLNYEEPVMPTVRVHCLLEQEKVWSLCAEVAVSHSGEDCLVTVACGLVCRR